jgi:hypothetical protein
MSDKIFGIPVDGAEAPVEEVVAEEVAEVAEVAEEEAES